ncbi:RNA polymerase factor sigma-54, partial [bacterium]|nr:RNA polymerase factor sigma-54 [bacterium]
LAKRVRGWHVVVSLTALVASINGPLEQVATTLGCEEDDVEEVLEALQELDPAGVCARNLAECLALQLKDKGEFTPAFGVMLEKLELIARGEIEQVAKACGVSKEKLGEMLKTIRTLDPKPGLQYGDSQTSILPPDVIIRANKSGGWDVTLNHDTLPKVLINQRYVSRIEGSARAAEAKKFLNEKLNHANWLIKAIDSRANTLLAVATEIVSKQSMFFKYGVRHLKPLTLRQVAEVTGVHESTVSRVTTGKTLSSPRGTYDLKYFFTSHVEQDGDALSSEAVKAHIQKLIANEPADKPLSDDSITEALEAMGIDIARRTVMKYREAMGIGSSVERRRQRKITAGLG